MHEYLIGICICFSYVCHIPIELNGGGLRPPPYREGGTPPPLWNPLSWMEMWQTYEKHMQIPIKYSCI